LLGCGLLFAFLYWRWWLVGVDALPGPRLPCYEPPPDLGPGAVRYLDRMGFDDKCFAAALLGLGARGFLKIREHGGVYDIERTGKELGGRAGESAILGVRPGAAYSVPGRKLQDHIEGLRQYLVVAEADALRRMKAPPQTAGEFARFLPYALALGVEKTWAERFTATLGAPAVAAAVSYYYQSDSFSGGSGFGDSFCDLSNTVAAACTAPGSASGSDSARAAAAAGNSGTHHG